MSSEPAPSPSLALRERLLAALLEGGAILVQRDPELAVVLVSAGERVALLTCEPGLPASELEAQAASLVAQTATGRLHVVAVGAGDQARRALKAAAPFWQFKAQFGFHRLSLQGELQRVRGPRSAALVRAAERQSTTEPLSEERLAQLAVEGTHRGGEHRQLGAALQRGVPWATYTIAAVCVVLFGLGEYWADGEKTAMFLRMGANSGPRVRDGELWRLLASAFLHGDIKHLGFNMLALAVFGPMLERLLGRSRWIVLYALSALGGSIASALAERAFVSVGASGAIWGLMTAGIALVLRPGGLLPPFGLEDARRRALLPLVINLGYSFMPGVDIYAHLGGGAVGFALVLSGAVTRGVVPLWTADAPPQQPRTPLWTSAAITLGLAMVASVTVALVVGRPWEIRAPLTFQRVAVPGTGVSLELPAEMLKAHASEVSSGITIHSYGRIPDDPIMVELIAESPSSAPAGAELDAALEQIKSEYASVSPPGFTPAGDALIEHRNSRAFVAKRFRLNAGTVVFRTTYVGDRLVHLRIYAMPERRSSWLSVDDRIVDSLAPAD